MSRVVDGPILETVGLTKRYRDRYAVREVDWLVRRGSVCGLVGPNGAGKTTLLRMVVGLVSRTLGRLEVDGVEVVSGFPQRRTGALIEAPGFVPHLSGRNNLRLLARLRNLEDKAVDVALARVSLVKRGSDRYGTYSLGMKQRLGVASALIGAPDLLVLDEPSNGLDPDGIDDMHDLILDLAQQDVTVIVSSHALGEVEQLCRDIVVMVDGRLVAGGTVEDLLGNGRIRIRTDDNDAAVRAVASLVPAVSVARRREELGTGFDLEASPHLIPDLVRALVAAGLNVHEIRPVRRTLADAYHTVLQGSQGLTSSDVTAAGQHGRGTHV